MLGMSEKKSGENSNQVQMILKDMAYVKNPDFSSFVWKNKDKSCSYDTNFEPKCVNGVHIGNFFNYIT